MIQTLVKKVGGKAARTVLPFYTGGDWISFRIDTGTRTFDVFLNNVSIVANVDCSTALTGESDWVFIGLCDRGEDELFIEEAFQIHGTDSPHCVDGL